MKKIEVTIGFKYVDDNDNVVKIGTDFTNNGYCYKDLSAWEKNEGIIYAPEYAFEDAFGDADDNGNFIEGEELKEQWTRKSWLEWVKNACESEGIPADEDFIEYIAECILHECDWQDLSTMLEEIDLYENFVEFKKN